jgi:hypothetical protein
VKAGRRVDGVVEIVSGLREGDEIAAAATFFIDSESQMQGAAAAYGPAEAGPHEGPASPHEGPAGPHVEGRAGVRDQAGPALAIEFRTEPAQPRAGDNTFEVIVRDSAGKPVTDAAVSVGWFMPAMPSMNMPAMRGEAPLSAAGNGVYRGTGQLAMAGRWEVTVTVTRNGTRIGRKPFTVVAR